MGGLSAQAGTAGKEAGGFGQGIGASGGAIAGSGVDIKEVPTVGGNR
jgi:hypothetical protein